MSQNTKKASLIKKNVLGRHQDFYDEKIGVSTVNDFLQLSQVLENLKSIEDKRAFHVLFALVSENSHLKEVVAERGSRISKLQRGQTQPK